MSVSLASELYLSLISFAGSDSTSTWQGGCKRKKRWREGWGGEAIMLNTSFWGGDYLWSEVINRGMAIIWGNRVFMVQNKNLITETKAHTHTRESDLHVSNINMILNLPSGFKVLLASCYIPFYAGLKFPQFRAGMWFILKLQCVSLLYITTMSTTKWYLILCFKVFFVAKADWSLDCHNLFLPII